MPIADDLSPSSQNTVPEIPVAQYIRMSTDHQRYSTENQADAILEYASKHHMVIVETYTDAGRSGLNLDGRDALKRLINNVQIGSTSFKAILVYDISRWGRFQDADESAYYEYICKRAGIQVIYCAEQFANDGSMPATVMKNLKRAMAGEYSRELSTKVFIGQCRLIEMGFRQGGPAGFGLRRLLVSGDREPKSELRRGEQKSLQTDRVILIPGPPEEIAIVQLIYQLFVINRKTEREIADILNATGSTTDLGRSWTRGVVHQVLTNEKYIGNNVFNKTSNKLKMRRVQNPPDRWIRSDGAFQAIVDHALYCQARTIIEERVKHLSDEEMLGRLSGLLKNTGVLSGLVIDEQEGMPSSSAYRSRFGSLLRAYKLIGFVPDRDYRFIEINRSLRRMLPEVVTAIRERLIAVDATVCDAPDTDLLIINDEFSVSVIIARCYQTPAGSNRWRIRFDTRLAPDFSVVVRMGASNQQPMDYFIFPRIDLPIQAIQLSEDNRLSLDAYRFETLDTLYSLAQRISLTEVA